jgi:predicted ATPase
MIVESFTVKGLFGIIDADLNFNRDLSVILGRNASGKTSVLNLLAACINLDLESIRGMQFVSAKLRISNGDEVILIEAANDCDVPYIAIQWGERSARIPLNDERGARAPRRVNSPVLAAFYGVLSSNEVAEAIQGWSELSREFKRCTRLTFVRLDRTVVAVNPQGEELRDETVAIYRSGSALQSNIPKDPLDLVIGETRERFMRFKQDLHVIRYEAYRALMRLHFKPVKPTNKKSNIPTLEKKLNELRVRVAKSQFAKELPETEEFFQSLDILLKQAKAQTAKKIGRKTLAEESLQFMLEMSEQQMEGLLKIFDEEQQRAIKAEVELKRYVDVLERFLKESGKKLWFSDERFELAFYVPAIGETPNGPGRSLKTLSSGERQIVIVLTYLAFLSGPNSVFIIDEPELSLHLRWQGYLMSALKTLRPDGGQIIVATHAPEVAGRAPKNCIQLKQAYMPEIEGNSYAE